MRNQTDHVSRYDEECYSQNCLCAGIAACVRVCLKWMCMWLSEATLNIETYSFSFFFFCFVNLILTISCGWYHLCALFLLLYFFASFVYFFFINLICSLFGSFFVYCHCVQWAYACMCPSVCKYGSGTAAAVFFLSSFSFQNKE